jgi:phosphoglycerate dehydrogenase-like enzyme
MTEKTGPRWENAIPAQKTYLELLKRSDFVVVCPSQTASKKLLLGQKELNQMNPKAYLVHLASEESVDIYAH